MFSYNSPEREPMIKILIVDDHNLFREGLTSILDESPGISVVGNFGRGEQAVAKVKELKPDIIALGYDQKHDERQIKSDLKDLGIDVKVVRLKPFLDHDLDGTRKIIRKVIDWYIFQSRMKEIEGKGGEEGH